MNWVEGMSEAIRYIEEHLTEELKAENIAEKSFVSVFYFQKAFSLLCGFTIGEYIRQRRLTCAGNDLVSTDEKIIDIALKYGYDSPDSFAKAFSRFHGATPSAVRKNGATVKFFAPLKLKLLLEGGFVMDYKIEEKEAFTVLGASKTVNSETAGVEIPRLWTEHYQTGKGEIVCGMYGMCMAQSSTSSDFEYLIGDDYREGKEIPDGFKTMEIPKHTWAVFPCKGPMPEALQAVNRKIFSEWIPNCTDYEIAELWNIEYYTDVRKYEKGNRSENYYCEIWIPVKKK